MEIIPSPMSSPCALHLVLVEPEIPQNTGNIARTCAALGAHLHLVEPLGFRVDDAKLKRAGLDYWRLMDITYYRDLDDFFSRTPGPYFYFTTKGGRVFSDVAYPSAVYFLFGKETAGLPEPLLLAHPERAVRIPMISAARSLNLSNAAAVAAYEVSRQWGYPGLLGENGYLWEENAPHA
ncbi:MAG: tRNA (cytidine(34)-2'-O)-methyltransferase [Oscillospiraceae bacterium]|jgi:tRNA (cytidine/uridine-2'-O-)-methyltransferase|nr:tRNA (cytidine(34)-2'-O)-methyltransferase [Oscillospiraceae bacterium]